MAGPGKIRTMWRVVAAVAVVLIACGPTHAFYWQGWPGSQIPPDRTIVGPPPNQPPFEPPPTNPPPGGKEEPPGPQSPEPSTGVIGLLGLSMIAARRWWKKANLTRMMQQRES